MMGFLLQLLADNQKSSTFDPWQRAKYISETVRVKTCSIFFTLKLAIVGFNPFKINVEKWPNIDPLKKKLLSKAQLYYVLIQ